MEKRYLGKTEMTVPVVGMGTWRTFDVRGEVRAFLKREKSAGLARSSTGRKGVAIYW